MNGLCGRDITDSEFMTSHLGRDRTESSKVNATTSGGSVVDATSSGGSAAEATTSGGTGADSWMGEASGAQCAAHTLKKVTAITRRAAEDGRTYKMAGLESNDVTGMPAALTDISGKSITRTICLFSLRPRSTSAGVWVLYLLSGQHDVSRHDVSRPWRSRHDVSRL